MLRIGLTGGLGSGKSTVAAIFELLDVPVYYADVAAKRLMEEDSSLRETIIENFGQDSYRDGKLNKSYLAELVFKDSVKLTTLNAIVHPKTIADSSKWMEQQMLNNTPYIIKEAALIFESDAHQSLDKVIGVSCPVEIRIKRAMERDGASEKKIIDRMSKQMDEEKKMGLCDFLLFNDEKELLVPQIVSLHRKLLKLSLV